MNMLKNWRELIIKGISYKELYKKELKEEEKQYKEAEKELEILEESREVFQRAALLTQNYLAKHLSKIGTKAINTVFPEKDIELKIKFEKRRNKTECDIWIRENGIDYDILESRGYGIADVASFALRITYILLHKNRNILIQDEPFRNLHISRHGYASEMVKKLAEELDFQFILSTHSEYLKEYANEKVHIIQNAGESEIK